MFCFRTPAISLTYPSIYPDPRQWRSGFSKPARKKKRRRLPWWNILCATLGKKMTGSCQVTELWCHKGNKVRPFLREKADYCTLGGDIDHDEASFDFYHFRSELTCLVPPQCSWTFWSGSGQAQGQVSDLGWPYDKYVHTCAVYVYTGFWRSWFRICYSLQTPSFHLKVKITAVQAAAIYPSRCRRCASDVTLRSSRGYAAIGTIQK